MTDLSAAPLPAAAPTYRESPVVWIHRWNDGLMSFRIHRDADYTFTPGQFARIGIRKEDGEIIWRAYSIVSAPGEPFLEFFLVILPEGEFSSRVGRFDIGDIVLVEPEPQGFLTAGRFKQPGREQDLWMVSTGTGLAPYISMMRDGAVCERFQNIVLVLSVRATRDLGYLDELTQLAAANALRAHCRFHFVITVTREQQPGTLHGRITTLLESGELERAAELRLDHARSRFMLCGNPDMVASMRALLKARGFTMNRRLEPGHIIVENYW